MKRLTTSTAILALAALGVPARTQSIPTPNGQGSPTEGITPARNAELLELDGQVSIALHNGEVHVVARDIDVPGVGMGLSFWRVYRSQISYDGPFGESWSHGFDQWVYESAGVLQHVEGGRLAVDAYPGAGSLRTCATPGVYRKARVLGSSWEIRDPDGTIRRFLPLDASPSAGRLWQVVDRFGNAITCGYDGQGRLMTITDTLGRDLSLSHDGASRIDTITDWTGRQWSYDYDQGDLVSVTTPAITGTPSHPESGLANDFPNGRTIGYAYTTANETDPLLKHGLAAVTYPNEYPAGPAAIALTYQADQVETATVGAGTMTLTYSSAGQPGEVAETQLLSRRGFESRYGFAGTGHALRVDWLTAGLRASDPSLYREVRAVNPHGEHVRVLFPDGNETLTTYAETGADHFQHGNAVGITENPAPGHPGSAQSYTQAITYEPVYNQGLGFEDWVSTVVFDYQEASPPDAALTQLVADWGIDLGGFTIGLGVDKNGDNRTDQICGRAVWVESVEVRAGLPSPQTLATVHTFDDAGRALTTADAEGSLSVFSYDTVTGQIAARIEDADPVTSPPNAGTSFWNRTAPHVEATYQLDYNDRGAVIAETDPRGVVKELVRNELDEVLIERRAAAVAPGALDPLLAATQNAGYQNLVTPAYETWHRVDANGNNVRTEVQNVGGGDPQNTWLTETRLFDLENRLLEEHLEIAPNQTAVTKFVYDANGNVIQQIDPTGSYSTATWDERDMLLAETEGASDPATASTTTYAYDGNGHIVEIEHPEDLDGDGSREKTLIEYDGHGKTHRRVSPVGTESLKIYDDNDWHIGDDLLGQLNGPSPQQNDTTGNVMLSQIRMTLDEIGRTIAFRTRRFLPNDGTVVLPYTHADEWLQQALEFDREGNILKMTDPDGSVVTRCFDGLNRITEETDSRGNVWTYTYDAGGNLIVYDHLEATGARGVWHHLYDALGQRVREVDPLGHTTYYAYDSHGHVSQEADANGPTLASDPIGQVTGTINASGNTKRWLRDGLGRVVRSVADLRANGVGSGSPDLLTSPDPALSPPLAELDLDSNPDGMLEATLAYDLNGRLSSVTTDSGLEMTYGWDDQDRLVRQDQPNQTEKRVTYWRDGSPRTVATYRKNGTLFRQTALAYDASGRLMQESVTKGSANIEGSVLRTYQYNGLATATSMFDDNGTSVGEANTASTVTRAYDSIGNIVQDTQNGRQVSVALDRIGLPVELYCPDGRQVSRRYDSESNLEQLLEASGGGAIASFDYHGARRLARIDLGNGMAQTWENPAPGSSGSSGYDAAARPQNLEHLDGLGALLTRITSIFDRARNRLSETRSINGSNSDKADSMTYDSRYRLKTFGRDGSSGVPVTPPALLSRFLLDGDSAWSALVLQSAGQAASDYPFARNAEWGYSWIAHDQMPVKHDRAGNRTRDHWFLYRYDAFDRLVRIAQRLPGNNEGITIARFSYDALDRRIEKDVNSGAIVVRYAYHGDRVIEETDGSGTVVARYVNGDGRDQAYQMQRDTDGAPGLETYYYLTNTLGSVVALADAGGAVVERYGYDAFGGPTFLVPSGAKALDGNGDERIDSAFGNPLLFQGKEYDAETGSFKQALALWGYFPEHGHALGHYYFDARYMDPSEGRFTSRDPLALAGNDVQSPSLLVERILEDGYVEGPHAFLGNNPINNVDPSGLAGVDTVKWRPGGNGSASWWALVSCANQYIRADGKTIRVPRTPGSAPPPLPGSTPPPITPPGPVTPPAPKPGLLGRLWGGVKKVGRGVGWAFLGESVVTQTQAYFDEGTEYWDCLVGNLVARPAVWVQSATGLGGRSEKDCDSAQAVLKGRSVDECVGGPVTPRRPGSPSTGGGPVLLSVTARGPGGKVVYRPCDRTGRPITGGGAGNPGTGGGPTLPGAGPSTTPGSNASTKVYKVMVKQRLSNGRIRLVMMQGCESATIRWSGKPVKFCKRPPQSITGQGTINR